MIDDYLEFKLIGNFWKIINKRGCFSFEQRLKEIILINGVLSL